MHRDLLIEAIDIPAWLERDRQLDWSERVARDRDIASSQDKHRAPIPRVLHWWQSLARPEGFESPGAGLQQLFGWVGLAVITAGLVTGAIIAAALLHYDGSQPLNVLTLLVGLVGVPLVFLLLSWWLPFKSAGSVLGGVSPGALVLSIASRYSEAAEALYSTARTDRSRGKLIRWRVMLYSQQFGLAFSIAALATLVSRVAFSDLAFGWSTTLQLEGADLATWSEVIATPWSTWLPQALPGIDLIHRSHYYRLEDNGRMLSAEQLTGWWPFLAMSVLTYGVILRSISLLAALVNYRAAVRSALLGHSEIVALIDRMSSPRVSTAAESPEIVQLDAAGDAARYSGLDQAELVIIWDDAPVVALPNPSAVVLAAGGLRSMAEDLSELKGLQRPSAGVVVLFTKSWEPPLLDLHDYIRALRDRLGDRVSVLVNPVGEGGAGAKDEDLTVWRQSLAKLQDPGVYVQ